MKLDFPNLRRFLVFCAAAVAAGAGWLTLSDHTSAQNHPIANFSYEREHYNYWDNKQPTDCDAAEDESPADCGSHGNNWNGHRDKYTIDFTKAADGGRLCPEGTALSVNPKNLRKHNQVLWEPAEGKTQETSFAGLSRETLGSRLPNPVRCIPPTLTITPNPASANEGGSITFAITSGGHWQSGWVAVTIETVSSTASSSDYEQLGTTLLHLESGKGRTWKVRIVDDNLAEGAETFKVKAVGRDEGQGELKGIEAEATWTINASTAPTTTTSSTTTTTSSTTTTTTTQPAGLSVSDASATEGEDVVFTITLRGTSGTVTVYTKDGTATAGSDYTARRPTAAPLNLTSGESRQVPIATLTDTLSENSETFKLIATVGSLRVEGTGTISDAVSTTTTTVPLHLDPEVPRMDMRPKTVTVHEGNYVGFQAWITSGTWGGYITWDRNELASNDDYYLSFPYGTPGTLGVHLYPYTGKLDSNGNVLWRRGEEYTTVRLTARDDNIPEPKEKYTLSALSTYYYYYNNSPAQKSSGTSAEIEIIDDDYLPAVWDYTRWCSGGEGIKVTHGQTVSAKILPLYRPERLWHEKQGDADDGYWTVTRVLPKDTNGNAVTRTTPGRGIPSGFTVTNAGEKNKHIYLTGTVPDAVRAGTYTFSVSVQWGFNPYDVVFSDTVVYESNCAVTVVDFPTPSCPADTEFTLGEQVDLRWTNHTHLTVHPMKTPPVPGRYQHRRPIPGLVFEKRAGGWYLTGAPTQTGTFTRQVETTVSGLAQTPPAKSVVCPFTVVMPPPVVVTAQDVTVSEPAGDWPSASGLNSTITHQGRTVSLEAPGWASVSLSRNPVRGEGELLVLVQLRHDRSPTQTATASQGVVPDEPVRPEPPDTSYLPPEEAEIAQYAYNQALNNYYNALNIYTTLPLYAFAGSDYVQLPSARPRVYTFERDGLVYSNVGGGSRVYTPGGPLMIIPDDDTETNEHFWWEITSVEGNAVIADGDGAWGKTVIADNDQPPPIPNGQADLPWDADPGQLRVGRPADSVLVGLPLVVYFANVKDSCLVDVKPKAKDGLCGDDIWPDNHLSPSQWRAANVVWAASPDYPDLLEGQVFTGENIMVDLGDEFGTMTECVNDPPYGPAGHGKSAPGRRYVFNRVAAADDVLGRGECGAVYVKSGYYDLTVSVGWKQRACRGADADGNGAPEAATLVCSEPIDRESVAVKPVVVNQVLQIICWNQFGAVSNPHCSDVWQPGADGSPQWTSEPDTVIRY